MPTSNTRGRVTRRRLLRVGAVAGAGALAGCEGLLGGSDGSDGADGSDGTDGTDAAPTTGPSTGTTQLPDPTTTAPENPSPTDEPTEGTTTEPAVDEVTFDGGGAAALSDALRTVEANPGSTLAIEPGTYRLGPGDSPTVYDKSHFVTYDLEDVTIEGNGAMLRLAEPSLGALHCFGGSGAVIRDLTIEYDVPPFARTTVRSVDEDAGTVDVAVHDGYPAFDEGIFAGRDPAWATIHDPATGSFLDAGCCGATVINVDPPAHLGGRRYRLRNANRVRDVEAGQWLVAVARVNGGSALRLIGCEEPVVDGVTVHTSSLFVGLIAQCAAPTIRNVTARPREGSGRPIATTADGFHVVDCNPGPTFENCTFERLEDDAFAINAKMQPVTGVLGRTVDLHPVGGVNIRPGDDLEAISSDYNRQGSLPRVEAVERGPRPGWPDDVGSPTAVTFARDVTGQLREGSFVANATLANQGFAIRNCEARDIRGLHVRITSRDGVVENNEFGDNTGGSILCQPTSGSTYAPKGPAEEITIRNNVLTDVGQNGFASPGAGAITVLTNIGDPSDRPPGQPNRAITIAGNTIRNSGYKGIQIADARDVELRDNVVERPNLAAIPRNAYGIGLANTRDATVSGNRVLGTSDQLAAFGVRETTSGLTATGNEFVLDGSPSDASFVDG